MPLKSFLALVSLICPLSASAQSDLEQTFKNPPASAKPHTWWHWINGSVTKAGITADLEAMKEIGLGGAQIFNVEVGIPEGDTPFMSPQWKECLVHAFKEAKRLGIEICVHNCAGWSSSGGPWVKPEHAMQSLTYTETEVEGPAKFDQVLKQPETRLNYYKDVAVYAYPVPQDNAFRIPNLRVKGSYDRGDKLAPDWSGTSATAVIAKDQIMPLSITSSGKLEWNVPAGKWVIVRIGHTPTGAVNAPSPTAGRGPEVDKLSRSAMDAFWAGMMETALKANGPIGKAGLNNALIDSYEVGSQNWTSEFANEFKKRRGYDPMPYLVTLTGRVVGDPETTERFLWDYRRTVCDLFADNYFAYFKELCHKNGLLFSTEGYGNGSFDNLQVSGLADIPMGEFWVGGMAAESTKLAASAAHTNGRTVVGAESFTADDVRGRWLVDPYSVKALGDRIFTLGINRYIFHRYTHQPWNGLEPGMTMGPWGMNLERTLTWWKQGKAWMDYIARCQFLLQSGRFAADVLVFTGEEGPNDLPLLKGSMVPEGYDYDGCDATVLLKATVKDGEIVLPSGMRYRVLVLPESQWMTPKIARQVANLVAEGATVVGPRPERSPSLGDVGDGDAEVAKIGRLVWSNLDGKERTEATYGRGRVFWGEPVTKVLSAVSVTPDVSADKPVNWIHRVVGDADVYFVSNPAYRPVNMTVDFRVAGKSPEIWDPETGSTWTASLYQSQGSITSVPLRFESAGSAFVVFRKPATPPALRSVKFLAPEQAPRPPVIEVLEARYEAEDGTGGVDVAEKVRQMIAKGDTEIGATNSNFGDPTYNHVKRLRVVYTIDGVKKSVNVPENGVLTIVPLGPDDQLPEFRLAEGRVELWRKGKYQLSNGEETTLVEGTPTSQEVKAPWTVKFQANRGAPAEIQMSKLASWTESTKPGVKYFSGTASYSTTFVSPEKAPNKRIWLDLGRVKNFADVTLNGHTFPTLWKAPFRLDVTEWVKTGKNSLQVDVTNLWPNRLIGDEQFPQELDWDRGPIRSWPQWIKDGKPRPKTNRVAFTTWQFYTKDSPLLESGLIGPVLVRAIPFLEIKKP